MERDLFALAEESRRDIGAVAVVVVAVDVGVAVVRALDGDEEVFVGGEAASWERIEAAEHGGVGAVLENDAAILARQLFLNLLAGGTVDAEHVGYIRAEYAIMVDDVVWEGVGVDLVADLGREHAVGGPVNGVCCGGHLGGDLVDSVLDSAAVGDSLVVWTHDDELGAVECDAGVLLSALEEAAEENVCDFFSTWSRGAYDSDC